MRLPVAWRIEGPTEVLLSRSAGWGEFDVQRLPIAAADPFRLQLEHFALAARGEAAPIPTLDESVVDAVHDGRPARERGRARACPGGASRGPADVIPVLIDCDPGQDDAIALLLALASPELEVLGVTTVAGNQTLEKVTTNALRVLELAGRSDVPVAAGADRPLARELVDAADAHGESGLDGPDAALLRARGRSTSTPSIFSPSSCSRRNGP